MARAAAEFQVFLKPIAAVCNLDCSYCYYLRKRELYAGERSMRMPDDLLERYIAQHIEACPIPTVMFSWHGGEPTLLGVDYFRRIVEIQRRYRRPGQEIVNGIQTNGTLIDEEWCRFLAAERFYVGLSLDGPKALHDSYRVDHRQRPTHDRIMRSLRLFHGYRIRVDGLCVVHSRNAGHPLEVYRFFKDNGIRSLVFLPLVGRTPTGEVTPESVSPQAFGEFLCATFDEWVREDVDTVYVQMFEEATRPARGAEHALCVLRKTCGELPVLEHNGDLYSCDHYVDRDHLLGNLRETSLVEALEGPAQRAFGRHKRDLLPSACRVCDVLDYCNGGCPKDRFVATQPGEPPIHYLCPGFKRFFTHVRPTMKRLAAFMQTGKPLAEFAEKIRAGAHGAQRAVVGRNEPCPCGSGRKHKRCCGAERRSG